MTSARSFAERLAATLIRLIATGMAMAGVALAGLGATLRQTGFGADGMAVVTAGLMGIGVALILSGGAAWIWSRRSARARRVTARSRVALIVGGVTVLLALATQLDGLASFWRDVWRLAAEDKVWDSLNGPTALVFVPAVGVLLVPALEVGAAAMLALTCGHLVVCGATGGEGTPRLSAICALLAGGLVAGSWIGVATLERLAPTIEMNIRAIPNPAGEEQAMALALVARHRAVSSDSARTLSWTWAAVALLLLTFRRGAPALGDTRDLARESPALPPLDERDDAARARALLEAADDLHRTTPPARRF